MAHEPSPCADALVARIAQRARGAAPSLYSTTHRTYVSLVYDLHRDRSHGAHHASRNQTASEARLLHSTIAQRDPSARFVWFCAPHDTDELRQMVLSITPRPRLIAISELELEGWADCIHVSGSAHHSGPILGFFKLLVPLLTRVIGRGPTMILDTDTVALHNFSHLWNFTLEVADDDDDSQAWDVAFGTEHEHINGGLLAWARPPPDADAWLRCIAAGVIGLNASRRLGLRRSDPRNPRYAEQSLLIHICSPPGLPWSNESRLAASTARCSVRCHPYPAELYSTGCSPDWRQTPTAAYHYNFRPRGSLERAHRLREQKEAVP